MTEAPTTDRSLADRVDAIERALTADGAADTAVLTEPSVTPDRVEALEADLADLRAAVDALRSVVGSLDQRPPPTPDERLPTDARATEAVAAGPDDASDDAPRSPVRATGPLHAPTGRPVPVPDDPPFGDESRPVETDGEGASSDTTEDRAGLLERVTGSL